MRKQIQHHAPYVYLTQPKGQGTYRLFVAIPIQAGYEQVFDAQGAQVVHYLHGMTTINIRLKRGSSNSAKLLRAYYELDPQSMLGAFFNPDSDEIFVTVSVLEDDHNLKASFSSNLLYRDSDNQLLHKEAVTDKTAYNCPYVYLAAVEDQNVSDTQSFAFEPYMMLALKGYHMNPDQVTVTTPNNGVYETVIVLNKAEENGSEGSFIHNFKTNSDRYYDSGRVEGNFSAMVVIENNIASRQSLTGQSSHVIHQELAMIDRIMGREIFPTGSASRNNQPESSARIPNRRGLDLEIFKRKESKSTESRTRSRNMNEVEYSVTRRVAKTRNMSSRRRSPFLLDFRPVNS